MRRLALAGLAVVAAGLGACGGDDTAGAPGSPDRPLVATVPEADAPTTSSRSNESASDSGSAKAKSSNPASEKPGYQALVDRQTSKPKHRFTPCNLVSRARAREIVGAPVRVPIEAPQGPTCIYRTEGGDRFITLAVQSVDFRKLRRQLHDVQKVPAADATAYCAKLGQPMLYVPLSRRRVLSVAAPCDVATRFASAAVPQLAH